MKTLGFSKICAVVAAPDARAMRMQLEEPCARRPWQNFAWIGFRMTAKLKLSFRYLATTRPRATLIATCRRREAGGLYRGSVTGQLAHLAEAIRAGCEWYDLEIGDAVRKHPGELLNRPPGPRLIDVSTFFPEIPSRSDGSRQRTREQSLRCHQDRGAM